MKQTKTLKIYTLDEVLDETYGVKGTKTRQEFEDYCAKEDRREEEMHHRVTIPGSLYIRLRDKAAMAGQSVSSFVRHSLSTLV